VGSTRTDRPLIDAVRAGVLVVDGAMGSLLYERGVLYSACFEELNASRPELVAKVHEDFVRAGAQVIETNTFGANALRLEKYGLSSRVHELNAAGVRIARAAAGTQAYVVGAIGPSGYFLGEAGRNTAAGDLAKVKTVFLEQARALLEGNVDALVVETIRQTPELRAAVEAAVEAAEGRVPVIASASLDENGRMAEGTEAEEIARLAREWGASIVGVNC
jgi:methionine synthase I (cobalamin-dependent)